MPITRINNDLTLDLDKITYFKYDDTEKCAYYIYDGHGRLAFHATALALRSALNCRHEEFKPKDDEPVGYQGCTECFDRENEADHIASVAMDAVNRDFDSLVEIVGLELSKIKEAVGRLENLLINFEVRR